MKVKELIAKLQTLNPELNVLMIESGNAYAEPIRLQDFRLEITGAYAEWSTTARLNAEDPCYIINMRPW
jgi:hypothetical protein